MTAFGIALLVAIWILFAPMQAGGQASYVIVAGQSMEPGMHYGDLVILQQSARYEVGDVIAYVNADLGRYVIHRIIDIKRGRYILQGDNNSWVDQYEPVNQEVLGKLWMHLPKLGLYMQRLREPLFMALFAGLVGSMVAGTVFVSKQRENKNMEENRKKMERNVRKNLATFAQTLNLKRLSGNVTGKHSGNSESSTRDQEPAQKSMQHKNKLETTFFALAVVAFLSVMMGMLAFTRPAMQTVPDNVNYRQLGFFSYSAVAPAGVYDSTTIRSGEPVFPALTCTINVTFNYSLVASAAESIGGSYQLTAILSHPVSGWQRFLPLQERSPFTGQTFNTQADLNLCEVVRLIEEVEELTAARQGSYLLTLSPQVQVNGLVEGRTLETSFEPELSFQYDRTQFYLAGQGEGDQLHPNETGFLHAEKQIPNTIPFFGAEFNAPALRSVALIGFVLSLVGLAMLGLQLEYISRNDRETFVRMKYDPLVIDVDRIEENRNLPQVSVRSIDALAKLAEKHNAMILHYVERNVDQYLVHTNGLSYLYAQVKNQPIDMSLDENSDRSLHN